MPSSEKSSGPNFPVLLQLIFNCLLSYSYEKLYSRCVSTHTPNLASSHSVRSKLIGSPPLLALIRSTFQKNVCQGCELGRIVLCRSLETTCRTILVYIGKQREQAHLVCEALLGASTTDSLHHASHCLWGILNISTNYQFSSLG